MPDITMCMNNKCPKKEKCFRFMAQSYSERQSYASFPDGEECKYFIPIEEGMKVKDE